MYDLDEFININKHNGWLLKYSWSIKIKITSTMINILIPN